MITCDARARVLGWSAVLAAVALLVFTYRQDGWQIEGDIELVTQRYSEIAVTNRAFSDRFGLVDADQESDATADGAFGADGGPPSQSPPPAAPKSRPDPVVLTMQR